MGPTANFTPYGFCYIHLAEGIRAPGFGICGHLDIHFVQNLACCTVHNEKVDHDSGTHMHLLTGCVLHAGIARRYRPSLTSCTQAC